MTPAARMAAAIDILDRILAGAAGEQALTAWARGSRFAGSGDRAAVRDHVYDALRCLRSYTAMAGAAVPSGRSLMMGALRAGGHDVDGMFTGMGYAPAALSEAEVAALAAAPDLAGLPAAAAADCPDWLVAPLQDSLGAGWADVMAAQRARAPVFLRVNTARIARDAAIAALNRDGIEAEVCEIAPTALLVSGNINKIKVSEAYLKGFVELQDASSQAAVAALALQDGMAVLDYCAGGGGKALAMAAQVNCAVTAHDAAPTRMRDLPARAARAGATIKVVENAAALAAGYDLVLVDAPCSGSGTWRRTPDAKWRLTPERLAELQDLQGVILAQAAGRVRPGGRLAYMTCSLLRAENDATIGTFLAHHPQFAAQEMRHFSPLQGSDGFFAAMLSRERP
ncbi:MAG: RsmB/NOP family class I SAM-dependent RNA methyltransferase [Albidovulum sp.]